MTQRKSLVELTTFAELKVDDYKLQSICFPFQKFLIHQCPHIKNPHQKNPKQKLHLSPISSKVKNILSPSSSSRKSSAVAFIKGICMTPFTIWLILDFLKNAATSFAIMKSKL